MPGPAAGARITEVVTVPEGAKALAYNSLWQVRSDNWSRLEESSTQLILAGAQCRPTEALGVTVSGLLDVLGPIERFWAFPGTHAFQEIRRLFAAGKYDRFAAMVSEINRALVTDSYRGPAAAQAAPVDGAAERAAAQHGGRGSPAFEVLIVEDLSEDQERTLRQELRRWRRPDDQFVYDIVVVPSFEDAIMAARLNFRLQACVVRRRFAHRSRYDSSSLAPFLGDAGSDDLMERSPDERAQILARSLARIRPELDLYLMTEISVENLAGRLSHHYRRVFHSRERRGGEPPKGTCGGPSTWPTTTATANT